MGRFRAGKIIIRKVNGLSIIFYDGTSIYVMQDATGYGTVFHRWWAPRGSYGRGTNWSAFRRGLLETKQITLGYCYELATRWDISFTPARGWPDLANKRIKVLTSVVKKEDK